MRCEKINDSPEVSVNFIPSILALMLMIEEKGLKFWVNSHLTTQNIWKLEKKEGIFFSVHFDFISN